MQILFVSTEAEPFAKSGGLGDVIGSLPKELIKQGADVRVVLPLYKSIKQKYQDKMQFLGEYNVDLAWRNLYCGLYQIDYEGIVYYFLDNENYFGRESYYGYFDDGERFAFYSKAVLLMLKNLDWLPEILHCNEWQTALVPIYLKSEFVSDVFYNRIHTVFTIHNVEYQGLFDSGVAQDLFGISQSYYAIIEYNGIINLLKGAIVCCDKLTTVSPTYAKELQDPYFSHKLDTVISQYAYKLSGIINGIDEEKYNPETDPLLFVNYTARGIKGKSTNKIKLQDRMGLIQDTKIPLIGMVGRLVAHKGIDLIAQDFDALLLKRVQIIILGTGDEVYQDFFLKKAKDYPGRVAVSIHFSPELANKIYAGSDFFLMPSKSEPCGIAQMISLRYGTIPIVRETGGLRDSIQAFNPNTHKGNGVTFVHYDKEELLDAINRGLELFKDTENWETLVANAFKSDFSWKKSAKNYMNLYLSLQ